MDILFAPDSERKTVKLKPETIKDLGFLEIIENITDGEKDMMIVRDIMTNIPTDLSDIKYRQDIMKDFLENESLFNDFSNALWQIKTLRDLSSSRLMHTQNDNSLFVLIEYLRELSVYVDVLEETENLENNEVKSEGLSKLREHKNENLKKKDGY